MPSVKQRYQIGDTVSLPGFPTSNVVGIDFYRLRSLSGNVKEWPSYTLVSDQDGPYSRWWVTDENDKLYHWEQATEEEISGKIDRDDSGLCVLDAKGDSISSSSYSSVVVYRDGHNLFCIEAFEEEVLLMKGTLIL